MAGGKEWAEKRRMCLLVEKKRKKRLGSGVDGNFFPLQFLVPVSSGYQRSASRRRGAQLSFCVAGRIFFLRTQLRRETYGSGVLCVADAERTKNGYAATHSGRQNNKTLTLKYWTKLVEKKKQKKNVHR